MQLSGRKAILFVSPFVIGLLAVSRVFAATTSTVHVETESNGESHVDVQSNTSSSDSSITKTTGSTDVTIICNGVKKTYHSDNAENVDLHCDDDITGTVKTQVSIKNNISTTITPPSETSKSAKMDEEKAKQEVKAAEERMETDKKDLFEKVTELIRNFFKNLLI